MSWTFKSTIRKLRISNAGLGRPSVIDIGAPEGSLMEGLGWYEFDCLVIFVLITL